MRGPDLTHVGSRLYLAADSLENTADNMRRWLADPQAVKPSNAMPKMPLSDEALAQLVSYLASLK